MDRVICVVAPEELRIRRVMERDHLTREEVIRRMASQWPEERKAAMADFVIVNDGIKQPEVQVMEVHRMLGG
jgi:dephospho-CoA kinase